MLPNTRSALNSQLRFLSSSLTALAESADGDQEEIILNVASQLNDLQERNHPVRVGIAGMMGAGKSTLINALLGTRLLAVGDGAVTSVPTYISNNLSGMYRAEFHFLSKADIEEELCAFSALQQDGCKKTSDPFKARYARLKVFFKGRMDVTANYTELEPQPFDRPEISIDGAGEKTDINILETADNMVDLVGALPLVIECASPERFTEIFNSIYGCAAISAALRHVDVFGPFENLPPEVVIVDTPGVNDSKKSRLDSHSTIREIPTLDELWLVGRVGEALNNADDERLVLEAFSNNVSIRVIMTHAEGRNDESKARVMEIIRRNLTSHLNPGDDDGWDERVLNEEERIAIAAMIDNVCVNAEFTFMDDGYIRGIDGLVLRVAEFGRNEQTRIQAIMDELEEIKENAFDEHCLLPQAIASVAYAACVEAVEIAARVDIGHIARAISADCHRKWPTHGNTIQSVMSPNRQGVNRKSTFGPIDIIGDISNKWALLMRHQLNNMLRKIEEALRIAERAAQDDRNIESIRRKIRRLIDRCNSDSVDVMTARVSEAVRRYMLRWGFFNSTSRGSAWGRNYLPTPDEIQKITAFLCGDVNSALLGLKTKMDKSRLFHGRKFGALTPALRTEVLHILATPDFDESAAEYDFMCPISLEIMRDPTRVEPCRHIFDRASIEEWMQEGRMTCPICRQRIQHLAGAVELKWRLEAYRARHHEHAAPSDADMGFWWNVLWQRVVNDARENVAAAGEDIGEN